MPEQLTHHRAEQSLEIAKLSDTHQMPFFVLPTLENNNIFTLPGGNLIRGMRNAVTSHEQNAIAIAGRHGLGVKARGGLSLPIKPDVRAYGFVVEPAWRTAIPEYADFTHSSAQDPLHHYALELHEHEALLDQLEEEAKQEPVRQLDVAFVRAFGGFILNHR
ncbi:hypothetical protein D3C85_1356040 [compost metagenome]